MKAVLVVLLLTLLTGATTCLLLRKHIFVSKPLPWPDAQTYCRNNYVDLSTIDSEEELDRFKMDVRYYLSVRSWIGLTKDQDQLDFNQWSDGTELRFTAWQSGTPDGKSSQHCVTINNAQFNDYFCTNNMPFICYTYEPTLIIVKELKTWPEALVHCRTQYTDLISLSTELDLKVVNNNIMDFQNTSLWTGLNFKDGYWFWVNNEILTNPFLLPSCPIQPFRCGAKVGVDRLENTDCMKKMNFMCYQMHRYVCQLLI